MPAAVRGQDPARGLADDDSRAFLTLLPLLNPAPGRPFLFFLDQKNAAVTLVSASGGVFLSLSSHGAEKALPRKPSQAIGPWVRYHLTWQAEERVCTLAATLVPCLAWLRKRGLSDLGSSN